MNPIVPNDQTGLFDRVAAILEEARDQVVRAVQLGWSHYRVLMRIHDEFTASDDNLTIGPILCTKKCDTVARYSVLNDRKQIFASKYMPNLPTEKRLRLEIERERKLIDTWLEG